MKKLLLLIVILGWSFFTANAQTVTGSINGCVDAQQTYQQNPSGMFPQWYIENQDNNSTAASGTGDVATFTPHVAGNYLVVFISNDLQDSVSLPVIINPLPNITVTSSIPDSSVGCQNIGVVYTASGGLAYNLYMDGVQLITGYGVFLIYNSGEYVIEGIDSNGCFNQTAAIDQKIEASPDVVTTFTNTDDEVFGSNVNICDGSISLEIHPIFSPDDNADIVTALWTNGSTSLSSNIIGPGTHGCIFTSNHGCEYEKSYTVTLVDLKKPKINVTNLPEIKATTKNYPFPPYGYQWYKGNKEINGATNQSYTITASAKYSVRAFVPGGCEAVSKKVLITLPGEKLNAESEIISRISVYPNPTSDYLNVTGVEDVTGLTLFDLSGRQVETATAVERLDVSKVPDGLYILRIVAKGKSENKKVMIQH